MSLSEDINAYIMRFIQANTTKETMKTFLLREWKTFDYENNVSENGLYDTIEDACEEMMETGFYDPDMVVSEVQTYFSEFLEGLEYSTTLFMAWNHEQVHNDLKKFIDDEFAEREDEDK
jgi:hypothetical protein